jgi:hypothetical protein
VTDRQKAIRKHLTDMYSVEEHILEAVQRQRGAEKLRNNVDANKVVIEIERVMTAHRNALRMLIEEYGGEGGSVVKRAVSEVLGVFAGLYDKVRDHELSRMLRDDYTALSLAAMSYTALHSFGLAIKEARIADTALEHLKDLTPVLVEISRVLPEVVVQEVAEESSFPVDRSVGSEAARNTHAAWSRETVGAA